MTNTTIMNELLESGCRWINRRHSAKDSKSWRFCQNHIDLVIKKMNDLTGWGIASCQAHLDNYFLNNKKFTN